MSQPRVPEGVPLHSVCETPSAPVARPSVSATDTPSGGTSTGGHFRCDSPAMPQTPVLVAQDARDTRIARSNTETPSAIDATAMQQRMVRPIPVKSTAYRSLLAGLGFAKVAKP